MYHFYILYSFLYAFIYKKYSQIVFYINLHFLIFIAKSKMLTLKLAANTNIVNTIFYSAYCQKISGVALLINSSYFTLFSNTPIISLVRLMPSLCAGISYLANHCAFESSSVSIVMLSFPSSSAKYPISTLLSYPHG